MSRNRLLVVIVALTAVLAAASGKVVWRNETKKKPQSQKTS